MEGGAVGHILKGTHPGTIPARLGLIWFSGFRGEDLNVKVYDVWRTPSDGKSSLGLWPGELKNVRVIQYLLAYNIKRNKMNCELLLTYDTLALRQTGSRNLMDPWWIQKRFPRYGVPIWSVWPNIRSLPSIVAEKNVTENVHICSMCIKTN